MDRLPIHATNLEVPIIFEVDRWQYVDAHIFKNIQDKNKPAILENCHFGDCMSRWNLEYLNEKLNNEQIVIHESDYANLDFLQKNFQYRICTFSEFSQKLQNPQSHVYLRSINREPRAKKAAKIEQDFSILAQDLNPPTYIPYGGDNKLYHSSVLRIASSNIQIWTHFDLYNNVLCQVVGTKRVILLAPEEIRNLYIEGDKSPVNDFDNLDECLKLYPRMREAKLHRCLLKPGEVLYIPSLWWHNIRTVNETTNCDKGYSIGFNVFWRDELLDENSQYADRDVYGNKNLPSFESALANLDKALNHLDKLPLKYKTFYRVMLFERLKSKIFPKEPK